MFSLIFMSAHASFRNRSLFGFLLIIPFFIFLHNRGEKENDLFCSRTDPTFFFEILKEVQSSKSSGDFFQKSNQIFSTSVANIYWSQKFI